MLRLTCGRVGVSQWPAKLDTPTLKEPVRSQQPSGVGAFQSPSESYSHIDSITFHFQDSLHYSLTRYSTTFLNFIQFTYCICIQCHSLTLSSINSVIFIQFSVFIHCLKNLIYLIRDRVCRAVTLVLRPRIISKNSDFLDNSLCSKTPRFLK